MPCMVLHVDGALRRCVKSAAGEKPSKAPEMMNQSAIFHSVQIVRHRNDQGTSLVRSYR